MVSVSLGSTSDTSVAFPIPRVPDFSGGPKWGSQRTVKRATKTIRSIVDEINLDPEGEQRIYPDIVVHRRGDDDENWLVIEVKKGRKCDERDEYKIAALLEQYGYRWGALLALGIDQNGWHPRVDWMSPEGERVSMELFSERELVDLSQAGRRSWVARGGGERW